MLKLTVKMLLGMLLINCLSCSHKTYYKIKDQVQLSPSFVYVKINGKEYISIERSKCFARNYRISHKYIGPIGQTIPDKNIKQCNKIMGYAPKQYAAMSDMTVNFME